MSAAEPQLSPLPLPTAKAWTLGCPPAFGIVLAVSVLSLMAGAAQAVGAAS